MLLIPIVATPNQSFSALLDGERVVMRIKEANGVMVVDVSRAGVQVLLASRALTGEAIIPYHYQERGNFMFLTIGDEMPDWSKFGISQQLVYLTAAEVSALRAAPLSITDLVDQGFYVMQYLTDDAGFYLTEDSGELLIQG